MEVSGFPEGHEGDGQPSPNDIAKAASSDGTGPRAHGDFGLHEHGEPTFSDAEMAMLEAKGLDVDHHHGRVYSAQGPWGHRRLTWVAKHRERPLGRRGRWQYSI
jgi:hypothetical protein